METATYATEETIVRTNLGDGIVVCSRLTYNGIAVGFELAGFEIVEPAGGEVAR